MALAEGSAIRFAYKFYASGTMDNNDEADTGTDPGASGAQTLRRVSASLNLRKNVVASQEILSSRQVRSARHTTRRVEGNIAGELSPGTYAEFIEAAMRGTGAALVAVSITESDCTSVTADNATSKFTFASGNPVTLGLRIGGIIQFASLSVAANNSVRYVITAFGGTNNREVTVYPAPTDMTADTTFTLTTPGQSVTVPSSSHVSRKVALERYDTDLDRARLYTECRVTGFSVAVPADGIATITTNFLGRSRTTLSGGSAPYFSSPTAMTTTEVANSLNGVLMIDGTAQGVVTGININFAMEADAPAVVGQAFVPDVLLGTSTVTGDFTALVDDADAVNTAFENESEISILVYLTSGSSTADAISIYLPRVKVTGAEENAQGGTSQIISGQFQALEYTGSGAGIATSTVRYTDTAWS
jgi:hypothetical protein